MPTILTWRSAEAWQTKHASHRLATIQKHVASTGFAMVDYRAAMDPKVDDPVTAVYRLHVDGSLPCENLKLTPEQRLMKLQSFLAFSEELRRAGAQAWKDSASS